MKTKLIALLLALVLVVGALAACSPAAEPPATPAPGITDNDNDQPDLPQLPEQTDDPEPVTPEERALSAWEHYLELTGAFQADAAGAWAADFTMDMDMDFSIMSMRLLTTGHMAVIIEDDDNMQMLMDMTIDMGIFGGEMSMIMYTSVVDGVMTMRMIMDGLEMPDELIDADMIDQMTESMVVPEFDLADITSVVIEEDGNYTSFHFLLDATAMNDFIQDVVGSQMGELTAILGDSAGVSFELMDNMALTLVVYGSDDNPVSLVMDMNMRMLFEGAIFEEMDGEEMTIRMVSTYIYTAFGDDVVITPPPGGAATPRDGGPGEPGNPLDALRMLGNYLEEELFGTWDWDQDNSFTIIFNPDGTGRRNWTGDWEYFEWLASFDTLFIDAPALVEVWDFFVSNGVLDIVSQQVPGLDFRYIAR